MHQKYSAVILLLVIGCSVVVLGGNLAFAQGTSCTWNGQEYMDGQRIWVGKAQYVCVHGQWEETVAQDDDDDDDNNGH
jgi:hypothetical protein